MVNRGSITRCAIAEQEPIGFGAARGLSVDCPAKTNRMSSMVGTTYGIMDVTGRRIGEAAHLDAFSIAEFCARNGPISRALYYKLKQAGCGPREMRAGSRVLITAEAAAAWRQEREAASNSAASA